jgi:hypothetical protein
MSLGFELRCAAMSVICPFCRTEVPDLAIVCRGCGAQKRPGATPAQLAVPVIAGIFGAPAMMANYSLVGGIVLAVVCLLTFTYFFRRARQLVWVR